MKLNPTSGKFILQNQLRTWSQLRREKAEALAQPESPIPVRKRWGDSREGDEHDAGGFGRRQLARRQNTADLLTDEGLPLSQGPPWAPPQNPDHDRKPEEVDEAVPGNLSVSQSSRPQPPKLVANGGDDNPSAPPLRTTARLVMKAGRDGGGSSSGAGSQNGSSEDDDEDSEMRRRLKELPVWRSMALALQGVLSEAGDEGRARADALGDQSDVDDDEGIGSGGRNGKDHEREVF